METPSPCRRVKERARGLRVTALIAESQATGQPTAGQKAAAKTAEQKGRREFMARDLAEA